MRIVWGPGGDGIGSLAFNGRSVTSFRFRGGYKTERKKNTKYFWSYEEQRKILQIPQSVIQIYVYTGIIQYSVDVVCTSGVVSIFPQFSVFLDSICLSHCPTRPACQRTINSDWAVIFSACRQISRGSRHCVVGLEE